MASSSRRISLFLSSSGSIKILRAMREGEDAYLMRGMIRMDDACLGGKHPA
jgi:hypothetical protein